MTTLHYVGQSHYGQIGEHECEVTRFDPLVPVVEWVARDRATGEEVGRGWSSIDWYYAHHTLPDDG